MDKHFPIVTSVSGGRTSAYLAANYPADELVFALVRIEDEQCRFPDRKLAKEVEDRIQQPFIGTAEDDLIIYTMLDLEQFLGRRIHWVTGPTYEWIIANRRGWLPNKLHRYCTTVMKIEPIFYWWAHRFGIDNPVLMNIGYRTNETSRANNMLERMNSQGLLEMKATLEKRPDGTNKWIIVPWQRPRFPLIEDGIGSADIHSFWKDKSVRFAPYNNCVGCFHRSPAFLRFMFQEHPQKMNWFKAQEGGKKGHWRSDGSYARIEKMLPQTKLFGTDFSNCDSGFCEL